MALARVKTGDLVEVLAGRDRGKRGTVRRILVKDGRAVVADLNIVKKHQKAQPGVRQAGIIDVEAPIDLSNLAPVCPSCDQPTRVGSRQLDEVKRYPSGRERHVRARYCKKCDELLGEKPR
jgi:large subunit ribosomal protein L24